MRLRSGSPASGSGPGRRTGPRPARRAARRAAPRACRPARRSRTAGPAHRRPGPGPGLHDHTRRCRTSRGRRRGCGSVPVPDRPGLRRAPRHGQVHRYDVEGGALDAVPAGEVPAVGPAVPAAITRRGSLIAVTVRCSGWAMFRVTEPVSSATSACRGPRPPGVPRTARRRTPGRRRRRSRSRSRCRSPRPRSEPAPNRPTAVPSGALRPPFSGIAGVREILPQVQAPDGRRYDGGSPCDWAAFRSASSSA